MKKLILSVILVSGCLLQFNSYSQEIQSLTLKQAQEYALENNINIKNAKLDILSARKTAWENTSMGLPKFGIVVSYQHLSKIPEMTFPTPYLINPVGEPGYGPEMIEMGYNFEPIKLGVENSTTIDATLSQLIFNAPYIVGLMARKTFFTMSEQSLQKSESDVKESVANTYYMVLIAEESKIILDSSLKNLDRTLFELKAMLKEGFIENTDVDQLELTASNVENVLATIEKQVELAKELLKFQIGMDLNQEIILSEKLIDIIEQVDIETLLEEKLDLNNNINYQLISSQEKLSQTKIKMEQVSILPTAAAFYNHQEKTNRADFDFTFPDIIGVSLDIPIFASGQRYAKITKAQIELEKVRNLKEQVSQGLMLEAQNAQITLMTSHEKYVNEKRNMELSKKIYDKTFIKYKEGISSSMDLTQASSQFLTAQSNYFTALYEVLNAKTKLDKILNKS